MLLVQVDFPTCESIRMSQQVDKEGNRTLAVVTKVDKAPEGLLEKVTTDAVNIGLGYVCVRNRTHEDDTIEIARKREKQLFRTHPALKNLDKSMVGIPILAEKLMHIQAQMVKDCLPKIRKEITVTLQSRRRDLELLPKQITDNGEAGVAFSQVHNKRQKTLTHLIEEGNFSAYPNDKQMHYTARLHDMFLKFSDDLREEGRCLVDPSQTQAIIEQLSEYQGVALPDFLPHPVLQNLVRDQVDKISYLCTELVDKTQDYASDVVLRVNQMYSTGKTTFSTLDFKGMSHPSQGAGIELHHLCSVIWDKGDQSSGTM